MAKLIKFEASVSRTDLTEANYSTNKVNILESRDFRDEQEEERFLLPALRLLAALHKIHLRETAGQKSNRKETC